MQGNCLSLIVAVRSLSLSLVSVPEGDVRSAGCEIVFLFMFTDYELRDVADFDE